MRRRRQTINVIFLVCDHFEPRHAVTNPAQPFERVLRWQQEYGRLQQRCQASFGKMPLHTWFYPPHHGTEHLSSLANMVFDGLGEVELHYHHDGDTAESLTQDLKVALSEYNRWGLLLESGPHPQRSFGFIHGDWALGNSCGGKYCGVNDELTILQQLGCWADFTMPSGNVCQTRKINSIYYASGSSVRPKSHDWGLDARVGKTDQRGLLLMQGPLGINWRAPGYPRIENGSLTTYNWGRPDRIRKWLDCHVHVTGRPEWVFVKLHTHGAIEQDFDGLFGEKAFAMHRALNEQFGDGRHYCLHYVTARQAVNIVKAAEDGMEGNPSDYRDYRIPAPAATYYVANARHELKSCSNERLELAGFDGALPVTIRMKSGLIRQVTGRLNAVSVDNARGVLEFVPAAAGTEITIHTAPGCRLEFPQGDVVLSNVDHPQDKIVRFLAGPDRSSLSFSR
jgi:hypothetical protein